MLFSLQQLQQKMRSLLLAARSQRVSATQTEHVHVGGPFEVDLCSLLSVLFNELPIITITLVNKQV